MTNKKLATALKELGDLLVIAGQDEAKAARYARLAYTVSRLSEEVETLCEDGRLCDIPGVGPATAALLSELLMTGTCRMRRDWERRVPASALELLTIPGIGARTARHLFQDCGIDSLGALEKAVARGAIPGLDTRAAATLRTYFRHYARRQSGQTLSLLLEDEFEAAIGIRQ